MSTSSEMVSIADVIRMQQEVMAQRAARPGTMSAPAGINTATARSTSPALTPSASQTAGFRPGLASAPAAASSGLAPLCTFCSQPKIRLSSPNGRLALWACPCQDEAIAVEDIERARRDAEARQANAERLMGDNGLRLIADLTWEALDVDGNRIREPLEQVMRWLELALAYGNQATYRDPDSPPAALWLYSPGKGRGKTHVAAGAIHAARAVQKLVCFIEEQSYLRRRWGCDFGDVERVVSLPGDRAWLTVIDDLGQRQGSKNPEAFANVWYEIFNARWLKRGWTIVTSNSTPEQLWERQVINDATYSRLRQMTRGQVVAFTGGDYRLEV